VKKEKLPKSKDKEKAKTTSENPIVKNPMETTQYYVKTTIIAMLLFAESYTLLTLLHKLNSLENLFGLSLELSLQITLLMLALINTLALALGAWRKGHQYLVVAAPITTALFVFLFLMNADFILVTCLVVLALLSYEIHKTSRIKALLLRAEPTIIMRFATRGLLLIFSLLGGVIGLIDPNAEMNLNVGQRVADFAGGHVENYMDKKIEENVLDRKYDIFETGSSMLPEGIEIPENVEIPLDFNLNLREIYEQGKPTKTDIRNSIAQKVNESIGKYEQFFRPIMSVVTFSILQMYAGVAYLIYGFTIDLVFWTLKKFGFLRVEKVKVEQEVLWF
jgi:hypothetical protein